MPSEHRATVVPYSASPEDTSLTLMVECFECPPHPFQWGHLTDSRENVKRLQAEADRHNQEAPAGRCEADRENGGTMVVSTDESEKP